jgi:signal transduction histidine kinase
LCCPCPRPTSPGGPLSIAFCRHGRHRPAERAPARDGDHLLVEIGDNGPGIPEAAAAHSLKPFYTTSRPASGSISAGGSSSGATAICASPPSPGDTRFQVLLPLTQNG